MNTKNEIHIMYGLPGSGKTYYCSQETAKSNAYDIRKYLDLDFYWKRTQNGYPNENWLRDALSSSIKNWFLFTSARTSLYVDGLVTTMKSLSDIINIIYEQNYTGDVIVHVWNEDRETCLKNDYKRRSQSSSISIKEMPFESIKHSNDIKAMIACIPKSSCIRLIRHTVVTKPEWKQYYGDTLGITLDDFKQSNFMYSDWWKTGGVTRDYLGGSSPVIPDETPKFTEVFDLMLLIDENFPLRYAIDILENFVTIEDKCEDDYYGGGIYYNRYVLDLVAMYDYLTEKNYL